MLSLDNLPPWKPLNLDVPWGKYEGLDALGFLSQCCDQLKYLLSTGKALDPDFTKDEIEGYELVLSTRSNRVAQAFILAKGAAKDAVKKMNVDMRITNKIAVDYLKSRGIWEVIPC